MIFRCGIAVSIVFSVLIVFANISPVYTSSAGRTVHHRQVGIKSDDVIIEPTVCNSETEQDEWLISFSSGQYEAVQVNRVEISGSLSWITWAEVQALGEIPP